MEHQESPINTTLSKISNTRRWINQYIQLISTKPNIIHTFKDRIPSKSEQTNLQNIITSHQKVYCELGCGAGAHLVAQAALDKASLFIGLELRFKRLFLSAKKCENLNLTNVKILQLDARQISNLFLPLQLDGIFINFPDPWADKRRWRKHRLVRPEYINELYKLLKPDGFISYKTDHPSNFQETLNLFKGNSSYLLQDVTHDLYKSEYIKTNISSEFERLFATRGDPIFYLRVKKN